MYEKQFVIMAGCFFDKRKNSLALWGRMGDNIHVTYLISLFLTGWGKE